MTIASRLVETFLDGDSFNTGASYGPISINGPFKLFEINFRGGIVFEQIDFTTASYFAVETVWGLQNVGAGDPPLDLLTNLNTPSVLVAESHVPDEVVVTNSPSSNTAGVVVAGPVRPTWRGQLTLTDDTDFYFTTAQYGAGFAPWAIDGTFTVIYVTE